MALIIEDGTQIANSNTYVSDAEYVAYAAARGKTIGADATAREIELIKAMDYIEGHRARFKGDKVASTQSLQFPRSNVSIDNFYIDSNVIPDELKNAQMEAAIIVNATELLQQGEVKDVQKEKVDVMERSYFNGGSWTTIRTDTVDVYLNVLLKDNGFGVSRA
jgi:hypothetical protein